ncbi:MAG: bacillithiol biosynthesis deacetylase BshB1 [Saprospiraceae bacterium]|nr:bacillithiol biosynthesis deacetylase BshB1 [Saprospiraceae bacterium]
MKVDILAIGVHPDDVELSCSGTLLRQMSLGYKAAIVDLTEGELGTRGNAKTRLAEAKKATDILGVAERINLGLADGFFSGDRADQLKVIQAIRYFRPDIVLANAIDDRHPDHGRAAKLIHDACFLAGLLKIETQSYDQSPQERWRPQAIYHYIQDKVLKADLVVDVTPFMEKKMESVRAFQSQFYDPDSKEADSPISGKDFLDFIRARAQTYGRQIGVPYGEGFTSARPIGSKDLFELI